MAGFVLVSGMVLACGDDLVAPESGVIEVVVTTSGVEPDADGYTLRIDALERAALGPNATADYSASAGEHTVELGGVAANCALRESEAKVQVDPGDTTVVSFEIVCDAIGGAIAVTTATAGGSPDPDGYTVVVDGGATQAIDVNGTLTVTGLAAGDHKVALAGIAPNCSPIGDNPRIVTATAGKTTVTTFDIVCVGAVATWTLVHAGTTADLTDVWAASPAAVFVVGEATTSRGSGVASEIRYFDGSQWVRQHREQDLRLRGLWGSSTTDVYAVGFDFFTPVGRMLHYDGSEWTEVPGFVSDAEELSFASVWGTSSTDVWAVGAAFDGEFDRTLIYHFAGDFWQRHLAPGNFSPSLTDIWGSSPTDVYAVGHDEAHEPGVGVVLHYDGTNWAPVLQHDGLVPKAVWGSSASDLFLVGFQADQDQDGVFTVTSAVWHYDGTSWMPMATPAGDTVLNDVWGRSGSDVYVVGDNGLILHYDGAAWTASHQGTDALLAVFGWAPGDVYAVGVGGRVLLGKP